MRNQTIILFLFALATLGGCGRRKMPSQSANQPASQPAPYDQQSQQNVAGTPPSTPVPGTTAPGTTTPPGAPSGSVAWPGTASPGMGGDN